jgi:MoxR-vWA-beta-propeller ternary system domain bpX3
MTIQVPYQLRRRAWALPAAALFVAGRDPLELLGVCAALKLDPFARVFDVDGGFVVKLDTPVREPVAGALRLRALSEALLIPVDATLVPALLDDEAAGLVRDWGLVFLPGGRIVLFDRHAPIELGALCCAGPRPRSSGSWTSLPEPRRLADRLARISIELPEPSPEEFYRELAREVKRPRSTPDEPSDKDKQRSEDADQTSGDDAPAGGEDGAGEGTASGAGGSIAGGLPTASDLIGAAQRFFSRAGRAFERLSDKIRPEPADHSALLRKLVREFREGDPSKALRRAIPIANPSDPALPRRDYRLPWSDAIYRLADLLRRPGRGEAWGVRYAQPRVVRELADEYRKAAERAVRHGDFRRAAYIYGVLLADDRMAAKALERGGLHHDAAVLYLNKLNDPAAAAVAFEAAGMVDRALGLYRQLKSHESAGDLLRRLGDEDEAVVEYRLAAAALISGTPKDHLRAGQLLLDKARRPDFAAELFEAGWDERSQPNSARCGVALARLHVERGAIDAVRSLLDQADAVFESPDVPDHGFFYNEVARLASVPAIEPYADEIRDRSMLALARQLRASVAQGRPAGPAVSFLFGRSTNWPAPLVSDASFAAAMALKPPRRRARGSAGGRRSSRGTQIGRGVVTAVCQAPVSGELFVGFDSGQVIGFDSEKNRVVTVTHDLGPVRALAVDPEASIVVALREDNGQTVLSRAVRRPDGAFFRALPEDHVPSLAESWLTPVLPWGAEKIVGLSDGQDLLLVDAVSGMHWGRMPIARDDGGRPSAALLLHGWPVVGGNAEAGLIVFTHEGPRWLAYDDHGTLLYSTPYEWQPGLPAASTLRSIPIHWRHVPPFLDLVGLDSDGRVHSAQFHLDRGSFELLDSRVAATEGGYVAAARVGTNSVVAATASRIDWLSCGSDRFSVVHSLEVSLPTVVACVVCPSSQETLAVCADGLIARVK